MTVTGPIMPPEQRQALFERPSIEQMKEEAAFSSFVSYVFERAGYNVQPFSGPGATYQLYANGRTTGTPSAYVLVTTGGFNIGEGNVVTLRGQMQNKSAGYIVTKSGFTPDAREQAARSPKVTLLDLASFQRYIRYIRGTCYEGSVTTPISPDHALQTVSHRLTSQTKVLALANNKGGVGKTTTALNLAFGLANKGMRVLVVDVDAQANTTQALLSEQLTADQHLGAYFGRGVPLPGLVRKTQFDRIWVLPSHPDLRLVYPEQAALPDVEAKFANDLHDQSVQPIPEDGSHFDWIVIDTPPAPGVHTRAALAASHYVIAPVAPSIFAVSGLNQLVSAVEAMSALAGGDVRMLGCVVTQWQDVAPRRDALKEVETRVQGHGLSMFTTRIPYDQNIERAHQETIYHGINLFRLAKKPGAGATGYNSFLEEVLSHVNND